MGINAGFAGDARQHQALDRASPDSEGKSWVVWTPSSRVCFQNTAHPINGIYQARPIPASSNISPNLGGKWVLEIDR